MRDDLKLPIDVKVCYNNGSAILPLNTRRDWTQKPLQTYVDRLDGDFGKIRGLWSNRSISFTGVDYSFPNFRIVYSTFKLTTSALYLKDGIRLSGISRPKRLAG